MMLSDGHTPTGWEYVGTDNAKLTASTRGTGIALPAVKVEVFLVSPDAGSSVCFAAFEKEPWFRLAGGHHYGAWNWGKHCNLQHHSRGIAVAAAFPRCGSCGAGVAYASAKELSRDDSILGFGGKLSG